MEKKPHLRHWEEFTVKLKRILAAFTTLALAVSLAGCGAASQSTVEATPAPATEETAPVEETASPETADAAGFQVAGLKGPTTMGLVNLIDEVDQGESDLDIGFSMYGAADEIVPKLVKGELDAAAIPANLAATLYQKTNGAVEVAAINTLGVLYIVENSDIQYDSIADLKGKTILTTGKGTTPEYVLRYVLSQNGLDPDKDVTIEYFSESDAVVNEMVARDESSIAMLPQPFVTTALSQVEGLSVKFDMSEEWEKVAGSQLVTGVLVARKDAVEADPEAFEAFLTAYKASTEAANSDVEGTAALCETYGVVPKAALAQKALPECNIVFITGDEMRADLETYFQVLYDADPTSVGGQLPDDAFYYGA